jgi:hypothetical protein
VHVRFGEERLGDSSTTPGLSLYVRPANEARLSGVELLEHVWNAWLDGVAVAVTSMPSLCYEKE